MTGLLRTVWERLSLYLPVLLMGLLALGTYWLVRSTPVFDAPASPQAPRHEPDYFMVQFSVRTFDAAGRLKSEVAGDKARHYPDTDTLEIDRIRIRSFNAEGVLTTAHAERALTNSDASEVELMGHAVVVRDAGHDKTGNPMPRLSFRGDYLHAFMESERVTSDKPVELMRGEDRFTADSLDYDNQGEVMQLRGRVRTTLQPDPATQQP